MSRYDTPGRTAAVQMRLASLGMVPGDDLGQFRSVDFAALCALAERRRELTPQDIESGAWMSPSFPAADIGGRDRICLFIALMVDEAFHRDDMLARWAEKHIAWQAGEDAVAPAVFRMHGIRPDLFPVVGARFRRLTSLWPMKVIHTMQNRHLRPKEEHGGPYAVWAPV